MNKVKLIPKLAFEGIRKNGNSYLPYILITSFSVFLFFIFNALCESSIMQQTPHAMHLIILMDVGRVLLAIILAPILSSTYKFLMKQRSGELGLYNVLGLDRKDIGTMLVLESIGLYGITILVGITLALVFSKLIFLVLMNMARLSVEGTFTPEASSYWITIIYFGVLSLFNAIRSLWQVGHIKPIDLMKSSKKGERQEKHLGIKTVIGILFLGGGYYIALITKINGLIFMQFFLAVGLVVIGTRILFKTGTIFALLQMKGTPKVYYKKQNFITISGMLYRMKRNAQSLASICIFSTMIMITFICTLSLFAGEDAAIRFNYPMDVAYNLDADTFSDREAFNEEMQVLAKKHQVEIENPIHFETQMLAVLKEGNAFVENQERDWDLNNSYDVKLMTIEDYNGFSGNNMSLEEDEVLIYSSTQDFGADEVLLNDKAYRIKEEIKHMCFETKQSRDLTGTNYYIVLSNKAKVQEWAEKMHAEGPGNRKYCVRFNLSGNEADKDEFVTELNQWVIQRAGGSAADYFGEWQKDTQSMFGALLFIGVFFSIIFSMSLVQMMYYKQITEGYEDRKNFQIFKQVGMSDDEIKRIIKKQILLVFFLPLIGAVMHTFVALHIVNELMSTIHVYDKQLILICSLGVMGFFTILYVISYLMTSKVYYRIVK